ncbi:hypothetical protein R6Q59_020481 [Mikania micrantha]
MCFPRSLDSNSIGSTKYKRPDGVGILSARKAPLRVFINVMKSRYSDIMYNLKLQSTKKTRDAGFDIDEREYIHNLAPFAIIRLNLYQMAYGLNCVIFETRMLGERSLRVQNEIALASKGLTNLLGIQLG